MTINKYTGKTKEDAINAAKEDLGPSAVIMNVREIHPGGIFGIFKKSTYEVTAAIEDDYQALDPASKKTPYTVEKKPEKIADSNFSAVADEKLDLTAPLPPVSGHTSAIEQYRKQEQAPAKASPEKNIDANELKSVFDEVSKVITAPSAPSPDQKDKESGQKSSFVPLEKTAQDISRPGEKAASPATDKPDLKEQEVKNAGYSSKGSGAYLGFTRMLYNTLVDHEVDERYVNSLLCDMDSMIEAGNSMDYLISDVYQKMVLKTGQAMQIKLSDNGYPAVVFLVGPTGVGKTTTLAKLASFFKVNQKKKVSFLTADTYRIAATEQLSVYADILDVSTTILMTPDDIVPSLAKYRDSDIIFVDTVGFSHTNDKQRQNLSRLISLVPDKYMLQIYLVLSATTKYMDLKRIVDAYSDFTDYSLIFTKLDETANLGNIYNLRQYSSKSLSYITDGQNVPEDFKVLDPQKLVKNLLGGN